MLFIATDVAHTPQCIFNIGNIPYHFQVPYFQVLCKTEDSIYISKPILILASFTEFFFYLMNKLNEI